MSNSHPRQDNPRNLVVNRAMRRSPGTAGARSRISVRNLLVVVAAAAGLSIVPLGVANALPTVATSAGPTCTVGNTHYYQSSVVNLDGGKYLCQAGTLDGQGSSNPYDGPGVGVLAP